MEGEGKAQNRKRKFREIEQEESVRVGDSVETGEIFALSLSSTQSVNWSDESRFAI